MLQYLIIQFLFYLSVVVTYGRLKPKENLKFNSKSGPSRLQEVSLIRGST